MFLRIFISVFTALQLLSCTSNIEKSESIASINGIYISPSFVEIKDIGFEFSDDQFSIDFRERFNGELVELYIDGFLAFSETLITPNNGTDLTDVVILPLETKNIDLVLVIDGKKWITEIAFQDGKFVGIEYIENKPFVYQARNPFFYD